MTTASGRHVVVAGIDVFRHKNLNKTRSLHVHRVRFTVLVMERSHDSAQTAMNEPNVRVVTCGGRFTRLRALWALATTLATERVDLVEIYPESVITLWFFAIARLFRRPVVVVARGMEHRIAEGRIRGVRLAALGVVYRGASVVVYNELYMKDVLSGLGATRLEFLPNSIVLPPEVDRSGRPGCNFLYLNSMKAFRHPETAVAAFLRLAQEFPPDALRLRVVGLRAPRGFEGNSERERRLWELTRGHEDQVELLPWTADTQPHLEWGDVFLLPAEIVFLNYALLEAMGSGMPAIIQRTNGSSLIIDHGLDGTVVESSESEWLNAMRASVASPEERRRQGGHARQKIAERFSSEASAVKWSRIYGRLTGCDDPEGVPS
jgi:glycosyltransferase involved in cell wall biosynthesis